VRHVQGRDALRRFRRILSAAGLQVLQVFHSTQAWAWTARLDDVRTFTGIRATCAIIPFCRAMAGRFKGRVQAWEPWNEANIPGFGGHLSDEMCALQ
jgi:beta-glucosidase/6-phospho-beta-glucosidase/beta-galactosidase